MNDITCVFTVNNHQTFLDYYDKKWVRGFPSNVQLRKIANIVSRNFWQMDGLTYTVPNTDIKCKYECKDNNEAIDKLKKLINPGDIVLIKASNSMNFNEIVNNLKKM